MHNMTHYIEVENDRQGRIERATTTMLSGEKERLAGIHHETELALSRVFGGKLTEDIVARIIAGQILDADVLCTVSGGMNEMPKTRDGWNLYAKKLVKADPLAKRCLDFSNAKLREGFRQEALDKLPSTTKISMARANKPCWATELRPTNLGDPCSR